MSMSDRQALRYLRNQARRERARATDLRSQASGMTDPKRRDAANIAARALEIKAQQIDERADELEAKINRNQG